MTPKLGHGKSDPKVEMLAGIALFHRCGADELGRIAALTTAVDVDAGYTFCRAGDPGSEAFVVVSGEAEVTVDGSIVNTVGVGGIFGEMALLDGGARVATVTARTPMSLLVLNRAEFSALLRDSPSASSAILEGVGHRLRQLEVHGPLT